MLALAAQRLGPYLPFERGIDDAEVGGQARRQPARFLDADQLCRRRAHDLDRARQSGAALLAPLQGQRQQQFEPRRARLAFGERQGLGIGLHRRVVGHQRVDGAVGQPGGKRIAVALLAQRRVEPRAAVEVADVGVGQVQRVDADVAAERQAFGLGGAHQGHAGRARQAAQVHTRAGAAHEFDDGEDRDRFGRDRHAGQAEPRGERAAGGHALAQVAVLRAQPHGVAEGAGVEQRALQHLRVTQRDVGLAEADATGLGELGHFGEHFTGEAARERAEREQARALHLLGAELEHLDQAGLVEHGVGVGRADQAGDAAGHRRGHLAFEHAFVLVAGFAQPRGQVDQAGHDEAALGIERAVGAEVGRCAADGEHLAVGDGHVGLAVDARRRIDDAPIGDQDFHASFPATMLITAMRTAMPNVTCGRITLCRPSTTAESISTPRLIGPGCITIASGLASCSFSGVRP